MKDKPRTRENKEHGVATGPIDSVALPAEKVDIAEIYTPDGVLDNQHAAALPIEHRKKKRSLLPVLAVVIITVAVIVISIAASALLNRLQIEQTRRELEGQSGQEP
jgi:cell division protein FtsL